MHTFIRTALLFVSFFTSCSHLAIAADSTQNPHFDSDPYIYLSQGYPTYDGGRFVSAFLPYQNSYNSAYWWDTGVLLFGSGVGHRRVLNQHWWGQDWFVGTYFYFDIMNQFWRDWTQMVSDVNAAFDAYPSGPLRLNIGGELCAEEWGQLTVNVYGLPFSQANIKTTNQLQELIGISSRLTWNYSRRIKPILVGSYTKLGNSFNDPNLSIAMSIGAGVKLNLSYNADIEVKLVWGKQQAIFQAGMQGRFYENKKLLQPYFKQRLSTPPERYMPTYYKRPAKKDAEVTSSSSKPPVKRPNEWWADTSKWSNASKATEFASRFSRPTSSGWRGDPSRTASSR